ncbi:MAG: hypothetical protein V4631_21200 [Pseudomonadota bacterium]
MNTIAVKYVGAKLFSIDNVAKSGKTWAGNGDVQHVTPAQAKILTSYKDQWALDDATDVDAMNGPNMIETKDADGATVLTDAADLTGAPEKMNAQELIAYAKAKYNKTLKPRSRKLLLDEVMALAGVVDPVN